MSHADDAHGLRVQLTAALLDCHALRARVTAAESDRDALRAELEAATATFEDEQAAHMETTEALAAARRECEAVRKALSDLIQEMNFGGGCDGNDPSCDGCVAVEAAKAALAAPADGEEA